MRKKITIIIFVPLVLIVGLFAFINFDSDWLFHDNIKSLDNYLLVARSINDGYTGPSIKESQIGHLTFVGKDGKTDIKSIGASNTGHVFWDNEGLIYDTQKSSGGFLENSLPFGWFFKRGIDVDIVKMSNDTSDISTRILKDNDGFTGIGIRKLENKKIVLSRNIGFSNTDNESVADTDTDADNACDALFCESNMNQFFVLDKNFKQEQSFKQEGWFFGEQVIGNEIFGFADASGQYYNYLKKNLSVEDLKKINSQKAPSELLIQIFPNQKNPAQAIKKITYENAWKTDGECLNCQNDKDGKIYSIVNNDYFLNEYASKKEGGAQFEQQLRITDTKTFEQKFVKLINSNCSVFHPVIRTKTDKDYFDETGNNTTKLGSFIKKGDLLYASDTGGILYSINIKTGIVAEKFSLYHDHEIRDDMDDSFFKIVKTNQGVLTFEYDTKTEKTFINFFNYDDGEKQALLTIDNIRKKLPSTSSISAIAFNPALINCLNSDKPCDVKKYLN